MAIQDKNIRKFILNDLVRVIWGEIIAEAKLTAAIEARS